tara:strand:- start:282 stop:647 length:366 start_codon:yes stop_codon:yes gene_type:complete
MNQQEIKMEEKGKMVLSGQAKEKFEKWYFSTQCLIIKGGQGVAIINKGVVGLNRFYYLPDSMKFGVYQDFADSVGFRIVIATPKRNGFYWEIGAEESIVFKTRSEARKAAIEKFNEIFNTN